MSKKDRFHRFGVNGRWTRSFVIRWGNVNSVHRVVHQGALFGSSGPAGVVELYACLDEGGGGGGGGCGGRVGGLAGLECACTWPPPSSSSPPYEYGTDIR